MKVLHQYSCSKKFYVHKPLCNLVNVCLSVDSESVDSTVVLFSQERFQQLFVQCINVPWNHPV